MLSSIAIEPNLWPTSAVIDWYGILQRMPDIRDRDARLSRSGTDPENAAELSGNHDEFFHRTDRLPLVADDFAG